MARWEFKLPDLGEGVAEGEIVAWLVRPGEAVKEDQPMLEVMTDKATVTIAAPRTGTVTETHGRVGDVVRVHSVLVVFELDGAASPSNGARGNGHTTDDLGPAATAVGDIRESLPGIGAARPGPMRDPSPAVPGDGYYNAKPLATPATRKLARDMSVDLRRVPPSGPQGRVTRRDVERFRPGVPAQAATTPAAAHASEGAPSAASPLASPLPRWPGEERVAFAGLRRRIAQKMQQSTQTAAHFTFVEECDVTALKALRARLKPAAEVEGVKLSFLPFVVKATVAALKKHPILNTTLDQASGELVFRKYFHIGIATATEAGLVVPVVKDADRKSILDIAREIERLADDARTGKAKLEDLQGSTFTITSLGTRGGLFATPIINFPEVAILGVHQMKQRPVVKGGQIVIGDVMLLSLSFDHRVVDGHVGAAFAYEIIAYLEEPDRLFLELA